jgi:glycosyltransferase involved in cell wall biosynthesis
MSRPAYRTEPLSRPVTPLNVFVLLAYGFGARGWSERWARGELAGIQERLPYGYFHCAADNCEIRYSEDAAENRFTQFFRMCLRRLLGFDLIHAWRNRDGLAAADIVWTHTELEHLAVLLLFRLGFARARRPPVIAQSVWLFDRWQHFSPLRRWVYRRLLERADLLTVLSPENLRLARELFPDQRSEFVRFGIDAEKMRPLRRRALGCPLRVLSLGNDLHRDWDSLIDALGGWTECEVRIGGKRIGRKVRRRTSKFANFEIVTPATVADSDQLYEWADLLVVPLKPNFHASGITVVTEAVLLGVPVICTDTGGLRAYFSSDEVCYVPPSDPKRLRQAIEQLSRADDLRFAMTRRAQARVTNAKLNSRNFARRHYELSRTLLEPPAVELPVSVELPARAAHQAAAQQVRVFVFLGHGFGARNWTRRWEAGQIGGINERLPYGYFHAGGGGWTIEYSEDTPEVRPVKYLRSAIRLLLGFDLMHAWRNRVAILGADVVWTNTEFEHLAALFLLCWRPPEQRPRIIAESVWLFDRWPRMSAPRRWLYRHLLSHADAMVVLSPENHRVARALFPHIRTEFIPFGINPGAIKPPVVRPPQPPLRILSLGNDIHRDWQTLIDAIKSLDDCEVRIGGKRILWRTRGRTRGVPQIVMRRATSAQDVAQLYAWADLVVVPLKPNLHASGITVIAEAVSCGVPVVCADTGGLRSYFSGEEICYVAPGDPAALRAAIVKLGRDPDRRYGLVKRAQDRIVNSAMSSRSYAMRHRELSRELLTAAKRTHATDGHG